MGYVRAVPTQLSAEIKTLRLRKEMLSTAIQAQQDDVHAADAAGKAVLLSHKDEHGATRYVTTPSVLFIDTNCFLDHLGKVVCKEDHPWFFVSICAVCTFLKSPHPPG